MPDTVSVENAAMERQEAMTSGKLLVRYERERVVLSASQVYIVEYHAGRSGVSRKELCNYAPHFYRLETEDGTEVHLVEAIGQPD